MIQLVKTLPHLIALHVRLDDVAIYSKVYTPQIWKYLDGAQAFAKQQIKLNDWQKRLGELAHWQRFAQASSMGEYSIKGDTLSIWPVGYAHPIRLEFFGDELEHMFLFDQGSGMRLEELHFIWINLEAELDATDKQELKINLDSESQVKRIFLNFIPPILKEQNAHYVEHDFTFPPLFWNRLDLFSKELHRLQESGYQVKILTRHLAEIAEYIPDHLSHSHTFLEEVPPDLSAGFISAKLKIALLTDREIFGTIYLSHRELSSSNTAKLLRQLEGEISVGDFIVHEDYGVAIYAGLTQEEVDGQMREYLELHFAGSDVLLVPVEMVTKLTKYIGNDGREPELSKLGKGGWEKTQGQVKRNVQILAKELLEHYARRAVALAPQLPATDSAKYLQFVQDFGYTPTHDQLLSTAEILHDMNSATPMNRLLVGDVGFGKTEVMMRAAFKMAEAGHQVAVLCPTTVLAAQHLAVFTERFKNTDFKVVSLSRFNTANVNQQLVEELNQGKIDIVVGTHRMLSKDVKFKRLGLLIIDEEQRFGVKQKEKIKQLNYGVHQLSVSATPIPRTLGMALSSIQDISIITQPPKGRQPIETRLVANDWQEVVSSIVQELDRGGQIYFVHNAVQTIKSMQDRLQKLIPGLKITIAHGQMSPASLDQAMTEFFQHKSDVLLCTTIIENGLDLPNVNTIIVNQAYKFGLSQLYQLRGRVGRSDRLAHCVLFYEAAGIEQDSELKNQTEVVKVKKYLERLQSLVDSSELGAGFQVASRDLEIRGAGDLLGHKQHGQISKIGYALYMKLLAHEMERLKQAAEGRVEYVSL